MNKKILGVFLFAVFTMSSVWAQGRKGLRINEVLGYERDELSGRLRLSIGLDRDI